MKNHKKISKNKLKIQLKNNMKSSEFDPFGSYTGVPSDGENLVQDQDDL